MPSMQAIIHSIFDISNIWWLIIKATIWFSIAIIIIIKTDSSHPEKAFKSLKSTLGFFLMFIFLLLGLLYFLFGQAPS
ncbi:hypothetical protein KJ707_00215 [Patescibacteria group bacterium]|nr:hypothetical protein [Patescibacteria group bacterium]MBU2542981.1 hypothetical protein [Patescibacteria group bacterium]